MKIQKLLLVIPLLTFCSIAISSEEQSDGMHSLESARFTKVANTTNTDELSAQSDEKSIDLLEPASSVALTKEDSLTDLDSNDSDTLTMAHPVYSLDEAPQETYETKITPNDITEQYKQLHSSQRWDFTHMWVLHMTELHKLDALASDMKRLQNQLLDIQHTLNTLK